MSSALLVAVAFSRPEFSNEPFRDDVLSYDRDVDRVTGPFIIRLSHLWWPNHLYGIAMYGVRYFYSSFTCVNSVVPGMPLVLRTRLVPILSLMFRNQ